MKTHSYIFSLFTLTLFSFLASSLYAGDITVSENSGNFSLVSNNTATSILVDNNDIEVVKIAAKAFASDVKLITGIEPLIQSAPTQTLHVIVGTLGKSTLIDQIAQSGKIDKSRLEGKWETFCIAVVDNPVQGVNKALVIAGSDPRGTAFGIFEMSRKMGVSPWVWWADVTPKPRNTIYVSGDQVFGPPSVKYRGMFLNDEDWGLKPWSAKNMDTSINGGKGDIGPKAYEKIFELMLRTKSNYMWPAMHACTKAFWWYAGNPEVARKYAIIMGSSHCEPMLRDNEDEWRVNFAVEYPGVTKGEWNWKINQTVITNYWIDRVKQSKDNEAVYTLGMRGVHDSQMLGYNTDKERAEALKLIIAAQRDILQTYLGKQKETVPQLFCPYKEALLHYNQGINLPTDVTLLWPDDNHGYVRQLSDPTEQLRSGGGGVYYHLSYLGGPQEYLWLSSISPALISYEMSKAYAMNSKNIWVFNVGDLKPAEYEYQFAMDLAWDINAWTPEKANEYARHWAEEHFGSELADEIGDIKTTYTELAASGKPEHVHVSTLSVKEIEQRLTDYNALVEKVKNVEARVPDRLKAAYFELILYPAEGAAAMNEKILGAKLSFDYMNSGKTKEALEMAERSKNAYLKIRDLTYTYNKVNVSGKWDGIMSYSPNGRSFFYDREVASFETTTNDSIPVTTEENTLKISVKDYTTKSTSLKIIDKLGSETAALAVWPLNLTNYTVSNITSAPYAEYKLALKKGNNKIAIKCLPTFPLNTTLDLRYGISIDGATPTLVSIKTSAEDNNWSANVIRGFTKNDYFVNAIDDKEVSVKIYFADPGLALTSLELTSIVEATSSTSSKLVNPDFELDRNGNTLSGLNRGTPYGWTQTGTLSGNSWGTNQDAANYHGQNVCWYSSSPMPASFELSQTVKGLPAGEYILRCKMAVPQDRLTTQRLFANKYVKYFGKESDYPTNLTAGEINSFAGYTDDAGNGTNIVLEDVALKFNLVTGEDLKLGVRSSNKYGDGTVATDNSGWFKVDYFRLELVKEHTLQSLKSDLERVISEALNLLGSTKAGEAGGEYPQTARDTFSSKIQTAQAAGQNSTITMTQLIQEVNNLKTAIAEYKKSIVSFSSFIVNPSFEYKSAGVLNDGTTFRGTPYGWSDTGGIIGNSFGINKDALGLHGNNVCWYLSTPMPDNFELYQQINDLPAGKYTVKCKMSVDNGKITNQRLFANNNVQYYGYKDDYLLNVPADESKTFATWNTTSDYTLQELSVDVEIKDGEPLKLGIRTSNKKQNGIASTSNDGWFKVDYFRLEMKEIYNQTGLDKIEDKFCRIWGQKGACYVTVKDDVKEADVKVVSLSGVVVFAKNKVQQNIRIPLERGLYVIQVSSGGATNSSKVLVK